MGYGNGYYDKCCCDNCKTSCGQRCCAIWFIILILGAGLSFAFPFVVFDIILVVFLFISYGKRDDDHGPARVSTAKCVFTYSVVLCVFNAIAQFVTYGMIMSNYYINVNLNNSFSFLAGSLFWRVWQTVIAYWFYASLRDDEEARRMAGLR